MTSKLLLYNAALRYLRERKVTLTEDREPRRVLDDVYDDDFIKGVLEEADWNFALRTIKIEYDTSMTPDFGFRRAFDKPDDWVRTAVVSADEYFSIPMKAHQFSDEQGYWFADLDDLYIKYVSDDATYGGNLGAWPRSFARFAAWDLANEACLKLTKDKKVWEAVSAKRKEAKRSAEAKDATNQGTSMMPEGAWNRSRRSQGGRRGFRDGGSRSQLIG